MVNGGVCESHGVDFAQGAKGRTAAVGVVVVAHKGGEEDVGGGDQDGGVDGPRLPDGNDDLLHVGGYGVREGRDQQQTRDEVADEEREGDGVQHGARDPDVLCVGFGSCDGVNQLQTGVEGSREGKRQGLCQ